jgi:hypothetical protein
MDSTLSDYRQQFSPFLFLAANPPRRMAQSGATEQRGKLSPSQ